MGAVLGILLGILIAYFVFDELRGKKGEDTYFVLGEDGKGYIKKVPKGTYVDGVKLSEKDIQTLRETGELDISDRKTFHLKQ